MARPRKHVDVMEVLRLRLAGRSLREIASEMRLGRGTVHRSILAALIALRCPKTPKVIDPSVVTELPLERWERLQRRSDRID